VPFGGRKDYMASHFQSLMLHRRPENDTMSVQAEVKSDEPRSIRRTHLQQTVAHLDIGRCQASRLLHFEWCKGAAELFLERQTPPDILQSILL
jgi:hypothetical protein